MGTGIKMDLSVSYVYLDKPSHWYILLFRLRHDWQPVVRRGSRRAPFACASSRRRPGRTRMERQPQTITHRAFIQVGAIASCCCCLPCNHCSNWTWVVEEIGLLVLGCVLRTAGNSIIWNYAEPLTSLELLNYYRWTYKDYIFSLIRNGKCLTFVRAIPLQPSAVV